MDADIIRVICGHGTETVFKMAIVCKDWRGAVEDGNFHISDKIVSIGETCLMQDLVFCFISTCHFPKKDAHCSELSMCCHHMLHHLCMIHLKNQRCG